jgi:hypothetical protein
MLALMVADAPDPAWAVQDESVLLRLDPAAGSEAIYERVDTLRQSIEPMGSATIVESTIRRLTIAEASRDLRLLRIVFDSTSRE